MSTHGSFRTTEANKLLRAICEEMDIEVQTFRSGNILRLQKGDASNFVIGFKFGLNSSSSASLADDKAAACEVLTRAGVPNLEHHCYRGPDAISCHKEGVYKAMHKFAKKHKYNFVIKASKGTGGRGVYRVSSVVEFERVVQELMTKESEVVLCPYYELKDEYRCMVLDGQPKVLYRKVRTHLLGDGQRTVFELLGELMTTMSESQRQKSLSEVNLGALQPHRVPAKGEEIILNWKHNLGAGADASFLVDENKAEVVQHLAVMAAQALGLRFTSVDVVDCVESDGSIVPRVIEANCGVMSEHLIKQHPHFREVMKKVYRSAVCKMLDIPDPNETQCFNGQHAERIPSALKEDVSSLASLLAHGRVPVLATMTNLQL